jgi:hypothetical protein
MILRSSNYLSVNSNCACCRVGRSRSTSSKKSPLEAAAILERKGRQRRFWIAECRNATLFHANSGEGVGGFTVLGYALGLLAA